MSDEQFYLWAAKEVQRGEMDEALAAKAFAKAEGDKAKAQALYMEYMVAQLRSENVKITLATAKESFVKVGNEAWEGLGVFLWWVVAALVIVCIFGVLVKPLFE